MVDEISLLLKTGAVMAAFYRYSCSWHGCGKHCGSLLDLIDHIEGVHIEKDPRILEKQEAAQPSAIPLSYINCFFTEAARSAQRNRKEQLSSESTIPSPDSNIKKKRISPPKLSISSSVSNESVDAIDEEGNLSDVSDDSWASDSFASDWIMNAVTTDDGEGKRYICPVPGCGKRYKNVNGIKYHAKNGHRKEKGVRKAHKCHCGKSYKSPSGLRHHIMTQHPTHAQLTSSHTIQSPHEVENVA